MYGLSAKNRNSLWLVFILIVAILILVFFIFLSYLQEKPVEKSNLIVNLCVAIGTVGAVIITLFQRKLDQDNLKNHIKNSLTNEIKINFDYLGYFSLRNTHFNLLIKQINNLFENSNLINTQDEASLRKLVFLYTTMENFNRLINSEKCDWIIIKRDVIKIMYVVFWVCSIRDFEQDDQQIIPLINNLIYSSKPEDFICEFFIKVKEKDLFSLKDFEMSLNKPENKSSSDLKDINIASWKYHTINKKRNDIENYLIESLLGYWKMKEDHINKNLFNSMSTLIP